MDGHVVVSVRGLVVAVAVALALVAAYLMGGAGGGGTPARAADGGQDGQRRVLTMTGVGEAGAVPDQLSFALQVHVTRTDLSSAMDAANGVMQRVFASLSEHGVERSDVQTTGLSMTPVYDYHEYDPPTVVGYRVSERASVHVDELKQGGAAVSAAIGSGGNAVRVSGIRLLVGEPDAVQERARDAAVAEATAKAEQYAAASGQQLGDVLTLREVRDRPLPTAPVAYPQRAAKDLAGLTPLPIRAGRDEASVTVQMVWELR